MYTNTRSIEDKLLCAKTPTAEVGLQNLRTYETLILSNSSPTGLHMQQITQS